ncbi:hypothetical protein WN943_021808 [Citrus x changshan-huyou]
MDLTISPIGLETAGKAACVPVPLIIEIDCQEFVETGRECSKTGIFGTNDVRDLTSVVVTDRDLTGVVVADRDLGA